MLERLLEFVGKSMRGGEEREQQRDEGRLLKFLELSPEEMEHLRAQIAAADGRIRIFIHPEYQEYARHERDPAKVEKLKSLDKAFQRILTSRDQRVPPIFIFHPLDDINFQKYDTYREYVEALDQSKYYNSSRWPYRSPNDIFVVPTDAANPNPLIRGAQTQAEGWVKFREMLQSLGVKKVLIAGAELYVPARQVLQKRGIDPRADIMDHLAGCLGISVGELRKGFEVELSTLTYPEGRKEIAIEQ